MLKPPEGRGWGRAAPEGDGEEEQLREGALRRFFGPGLVPSGARGGLPAAAPGNCSVVPGDQCL